MLFRAVYILFLVSSLILGSQYIGFLSYRQLLSIVMLVFCLKEYRGLWMEKSFRFFLGFVLFFCFTSVFSGFFSECIKVVVAYYLVAYIGLWSTVISVQKNNGMDCIHTIVAIGVIDAVVTILQSFGNPIALGVGLLFAPEEIENLMEKADQSEVLTVSISGIVGQVYNGYLLMTSSILSFLYIKKYKVLLKYIPFAICFIACFLCQQRFPFYVTILFVAFFLLQSFKQYSIGKKILFLIIVTFALCLIVPKFVEFSNYHDLRYSAIGSDGTGRVEIYQFALNYITQNFFTANIFEFRELCGFSPHNILFNGLIYGGIIGFCFLLVTFCVQLKKALGNVFASFNKNSYFIFFSSCAFLAFTANSLTHNASIITGDLLIWVLWGIIYAAPRAIKN